MKKKIIGVTVGSPLPKPNLKQTDPRKGDYVKGKDIIPSKVSDLENDSGFLNEHQDISGKLDANKLPDAINTALAQAKNSGAFDGADGEDGKDGTSPVVSVSNITGGHRITIKDAAGTKTVDVLDGSDGQAGNGIKSAVLNADYTLTLTFDNGTTYTTPSIRGENGNDGKDGTNGKTPVKGVDYFTEADKVEFLNEVDAVRYVEQNLTEEQKALARANIGVEDSKLFFITIDDEMKPSHGAEEILAAVFEGKNPVLSIMNAAILTEWTSSEDYSYVDFYGFVCAPGDGSEMLEVGKILVRIKSRYEVVEEHIELFEGGSGALEPLIGSADDITPSQVVLGVMSLSLVIATITAHSLLHPSIWLAVVRLLLPPVPSMCKGLSLTHL